MSKIASGDGGFDTEHLGSPGVKPQTAVKVAVPLLCATCIAIAGLASIIFLIWHASDARDAQHSLDNITVQFDELQRVPWKLVTPGSGSRASVQAQLSGLERGIVEQLAQLQRSAPTSALTAAKAPLEANFRIQQQLLDMIAAGRVADTGRLGYQAFQTDYAVVGQFNRANAMYRATAHDTLVDATVGAAAVILALLLGFGAFYWRSFRARASAEELADALRRSEAHLTQAQQIAGVGSWAWDAKRRQFTWSAENVRLHRWTRAEPPDGFRDLFDVIDPADHELVRSAVQATARRGEPLDLENHVKGGRLIHVRGARLTDEEGRMTGMIGTAQDVTDRFRRVEAERANRAKTEFISRMSHELRTPLNAILGFGQLLQSSDLDSDQHASVDHIVTAGGHLLGLINEILDISRIEAGQLRISAEPVAVQGVVDEAIDLVTPIAIGRSITVTAEFEDEGAWVRADVQRLKQVLLNLLSNAIKYNHDGGHVQVRASRTGDRVQIVVADDGPGIAPEAIDRLFSPFERLGAEQTSVEGSGLGLAVSRGMLEAMGGSISVESASGRGSAFTIDLASADLVPPADTSPRPRGNAAHLTRHCDLLCIDDNRSNMALLEHVFDGHPTLHLIAAGSAREGLQLARERRPTIVLLDLDLPDLPGEEVLARLKADPQISDIPVVIVAADVGPERLELLKAHGATACIPKPIDIGELLAVIDGLEQASVAEATV